MNNVYKSSNNVFSSQTQHFRPNTTSTVFLHHYAESIINVKNIYTGKKTSHIPKKRQIDICLNKKRARDINDKKVDHLFCCVKELRSNLDCLLNPGNEKYINIELDYGKFSILTKCISLPSGRSIYAGCFEKNLIISDGSNYYIECPRQNKPTLVATLSSLIAHLTQGSGWPDANGRPGWMQSAFNWFSDMRDPLVFPQAGAKMIYPANFSSQSVLYSAKAEFSAQLAPGGPTERDIDFTQLATLSPLATPASAYLPSATNTTADISSQLIFNIDGHEFKILPANLEAETQLQSIMQDFLQHKTYAAANSLAMLLEFDAYIGRKMAIIFHQGLYLKDKNQSLNVIVFKMCSENIILTMGILAAENSDTAKLIVKHAVNQIRISDYILDIEKKVTKGSRRVDMDIINDIVSHLKNKSFAMAKEKIIEKIMDAEHDDKIHLEKKLHYLSLCQEAFDEYRLQLTLDNFPPLARMLYLNTQQIYSALIGGEPRHLADCLVKLKFYHIFEYTRLNGISIFSLNFILPGEITNLWRIFIEDEHEFDKDRMDKIFTEDLLSFIYQRKPAHLYLDKLLDLINLSRLDERNAGDSVNWYEKNLKPFNHAHQILSKLIENNYIEQVKFHEHRAWHDEFTRIIHSDKTIYILLTYLTNLQKLFIDITVEYLVDKIRLTAATQEQRIIAAKIEAVRDEFGTWARDKDDFSILTKYLDLEKDGHLVILIKAAVLWYFSQQDNINDESLNTINVLAVLKQFISAQQRIMLEYNSRHQQNFTSIFQLKTSSQIHDLDEYYLQFKHYKLHDSFSEAQKFTMRALDNSAINYIDIIYPSEYILCFKVFSRNYVPNYLSPFTSTYLPGENIGYIMLVKLYSNRIILASTLNGLPFITDIDNHEKNDVINQLKVYWTDCKTSLNLKNRPYFPMNETTLLTLIPSVDANSHRSTSMLDILLHPPEEQSLDIAAPEYTLVAVKNNDIDSILSDYTPNRNDFFQPLSINNSLMTNFDYLYQATLISITDVLKDSLREYTWLEHVVSFIPFFTTLFRHWHDEEHKFEFQEVIFDIYDLISTLVSLAGQFKNLSEKTLKQALHKAIAQKVSHSHIKSFIIDELINSSSGIGVKMTKSVFNEISSFYNIIHPSGKALTVFIENIQFKVLETISLANQLIKSESLQKKMLRQPWKSDVDEKTLKTLTTGVFTENSTASENFFVINDNDYFPVFWDKYYGEWRIINSYGPDYKNLAIPVARSHSGNWVASVGQLVDLKFSSFSFSPVHPKWFDSAKIIIIEPARIITNVKPPDNDLIRFHKKILNFYLQRHYFSQRVIGRKVEYDLFLDKSFHSFSIKHEILALQEFDGFSHDKKAAELAIKTMNEQDVSIVHLRAICGWRSKHDIMAKTYFALLIELKNLKYVIDLEDIRSSLGIIDKGDVFMEDEWIMMMNNSPSIFELIKFKNFYYITDAKYFSYREATAPYAYIKNGFLLKEPIWYKPLMISKTNISKKTNISYGHADKHDLLLAARALRNKPGGYVDKEKFLLDVLWHAGLLDNTGAANLLRMIKLAKTDHVMSQAILGNMQKASSLVTLLKVNKGKLVAFYDSSNHLKHLSLCLGNGRFIGLGNDFFGLTPQSRSSLIIVEQMGVFIHGILKPYHCEKKFSVFAGDAFGATDDTQVILDDPPKKKIPQYSSDGRIKGYLEQLIPREQVLLGKKCHIAVIGSDKPRLSIKFHGAPFNVNNLDAIEFSDIIKGLAYLDGAKFALKNITGIDLGSCFSGYGRRYSTAQILADELGMKIRTAPHYITDAVRRRRPEWFHDFEPCDVRITNRGNLSLSQASSWHNDQEFIDVQVTHRAMHDVMHEVREVIRRLGSVRRRRDIEQSPLLGVAKHVPFIYIDILQIFFTPNRHHPRTVGNITLNSNSLLLLDKILMDYAIIGDEEDFIIEQAFMDIILSIDEFKYLSDRFNHLAPQSEPGRQRVSA
ncbi:hypothetical protein [Acerihabitans arboris]|uniref:Uncharacterized protein n=1 Tax=Acerihabitans arboris TaxID=2691583 RepID=A0A845SI72_9GAMM|nr:hypothetical protein [Acerihabitans arboris]NDL63072.1 hypothetical protein [Acerihabitans arboris]